MHTGINIRLIIICFHQQHNQESASQWMTCKSVRLEQCYLRQALMHGTMVRGSIWPDGKMSWMNERCSEGGKGAEGGYRSCILGGVTELKEELIFLILFYRKKNGKLSTELLRRRDLYKTTGWQSHKNMLCLDFGHVLSFCLESLKARSDEGSLWKSADSQHLLLPFFFFFFR